MRLYTGLPLNKCLQSCATFKHTTLLADATQVSAMLLPLHHSACPCHAFKPSSVVVLLTHCYLAVCREPLNALMRLHATQLKKNIH